MFLVACLYASVGLGGATGYLAVLSLFGITNPIIAPTVLLLNIFVAGISFLSFYREGYLRNQLLLSFTISSIPASYIGGRLPVPENTFTLILGILLILAGTWAFFEPRRKTQGNCPVLIVTLIIGAIVGLISGITGSGGGFLLIPVLLFAYETSSKEAASVASGFVVLNSFSGLAGHISRGHFSAEFSLPLLLVVMLGGLIGARMGSKMFQPGTVQSIMGLVLLAGGIKLILTF